MRFSYTKPICMQKPSRLSQSDPMLAEMICKERSFQLMDSSPEKGQRRHWGKEELIDLVQVVS